jgi:glycerol uptake facilitator-like aquaporin
MSPHSRPVTGESYPLSRRVVSEALGTTLLVAAVVGSGIMGERLAAGNVAIALLANTVATGTALVALILSFGPISGAHFNPAVTLAVAWQAGLRWKDVPGYVVAQIGGAFVGVAVADLMFAEPVFAWSDHNRAGTPQLLSEFVATFGLLTVIWGCTRRRANLGPFRRWRVHHIGLLVHRVDLIREPGYHPRRSATDTFVGIRLHDVPGFIAAQLLGAAAATVTFRWLMPGLPKVED